MARTQTNPAFAAARVRVAERGMTVMEVTVSMVVLSVASLFSLSTTVSSVTLDKVNREESNALAVYRRLTEEMRAIPFEELYASFNADPNGPGTAPGNDFVVVMDQADGLVLPQAGVAPEPEPEPEPEPSGSGGWGSWGSWGSGSSGSGSSGGGWGDWSDWWNQMTEGWQQWYEEQNSSYGDAEENAQRGSSQLRQKFRQIPVRIELIFPLNGSDQLDESVQLPMLGSWDINGDGAIAPGDRSTDYKILPTIIRVSWEGAGGQRQIQIASCFTAM